MRSVLLTSVILQRAAIQIQIQQIGEVRQLSRQRDDEGVLQIDFLLLSVVSTYPELLAL